MSPITHHLLTTHSRLTPVVFHAMRLLFCISGTEKVFLQIKQILKRSGISLNTNFSNFPSRVFKIIDGTHEIIDGTHENIMGLIKIYGSAFEPINVWLGIRIIARIFAFRVRQYCSNEPNTNHHCNNWLI